MIVFRPLADDSLCAIAEKKCCASWSSVPPAAATSCITHRG